MTPPHSSCRIRFSSSRLLAAPATAPAWLYKLAIHPRALSDRPARASETEGPPTSLRGATALRGVRWFESTAAHKVSALNRA